jgi:hypothetical protein
VGACKQTIKNEYKGKTVTHLVVQIIGDLNKATGITLGLIGVGIIIRLSDAMPPRTRTWGLKFEVLKLEA